MEENMTTRYLSLVLAGSLLLLGCNGRGDDDDNKDTSISGETGTPEEGGFAISGTAFDLMANAAADSSLYPDGLCVAVGDPTPAISGGEMETIATGTVNSDGSYTVPDIVTTSALGLLVVIYDCDGLGSVLASATGVSADDYDGLGDGDEIIDHTAYVVSADFRDGIDASLAAAGYTGNSIEVDGTFVGFVLDMSGNPIAGATVTASSGDVTTYYADADSTDGMFTTGASVNTATDAATNAMFIIPGAPISNYECEDGGVHSFESQLAGSQPGYAVFIAFYGE